MTTDNEPKDPDVDEVARMVVRSANVYALESMRAYKESWENYMRALDDALPDSGDVNNSPAGSADRGPASLDMIKLYKAWTTGWTHYFIGMRRAASLAEKEFEFD